MYTYNSIHLSVLSNTGKIYNSSRNMLKCCIFMLLVCYELLQGTNIHQWCGVSTLFSSSNTILTHNIFDFSFPCPPSPLPSLPVRRSPVSHLLIQLPGLPVSGGRQNIVSCPPPHGVGWGYFNMTVCDKSNLNIYLADLIMSKFYVAFYIIIC